MNTSTKIGLGTVLGIMIAGMLILFAILAGKSQPTFGSIMDGQQYFSTTTSSVAGTTWTEPVAVTGTTSVRSGTLGSVIITKQTQLTTLNIYDATTTNVNLRTGNVATSSIILASFASSTPVGTYTFDLVYKTGLLIDPTPIGGNMVASSTVTWR